MPPPCDLQILQCVAAHCCERTRLLEALPSRSRAFGASPRTRMPLRPPDRRLTAAAAHAPIGVPPVRPKPRFVPPAKRATSPAPRTENPSPPLRKRQRNTVLPRTGQRPNAVMAKLLHEQTATFPRPSFQPPPRPPPRPVSRCIRIREYSTSVTTGDEGLHAPPLQRSKKG